MWSRVRGGGSVGGWWRRNVEGVRDFISLYVWDICFYENIPQVFWSTVSSHDFFLVYVCGDIAGA